jgi:hypothetical protein
MEEVLAEQRDTGVIGLTEGEERQAQRLACTRLVSGCEGAVSDLLVTISEEAEPSLVTTRARELLAQVLSSWRDTLTTLRTADERAR